MLILSVLSCGPRVIHVEHIEQLSISPGEAEGIDWQKFKVKFQDVFGKEYKGFLKGWSEDGFLFENYGEIETLPYIRLENWMEIQTGQRQTGKGASTGLFVGLLGSVGIYLLTDYHYEHK